MSDRYYNPHFLSFEDVISLATQKIGDIAKLTIAPGVYRVWASEACAEFARRSESVWARSLRPMVQAQQLYQLPEDCLRLKRVSIKYHGDTGYSALTSIDEEKLLTGFSSNTTGVPSNWYLSRDRQSVGLWFTPQAGGYDGYATSNGSTTTLVASDLTATIDDSYLGMTVRIMSGTAAEGEERVVTGYVAATKTLTVGEAFSASIVAGTRFQVAPDTLLIEYMQRGNAYIVGPANCTVQTGTITPRSFLLNLPDRPRNHYQGCELRFTAGALSGLKTRITASSGSTNTLVSVAPDLPLAPTAADACVVTDVPNVPPDYHAFLSDYVAGLGLLNHERAREALIFQNNFEKGVAEAARLNQPAEGDRFYQIPEHGPGEFQGYPW